MIRWWQSVVELIHLSSSTSLAFHGLPFPSAMSRLKLVFRQLDVNQLVCWSAVVFVCCP